MPPFSRIALALAILLFPVLPACLYTGALNRPPDAQLTVESSGPYTLDDEIVVSGRKSEDPDGSELTAYWTARHCTESDGCDEPFIERRRASPDEPFAIRPQRRGQLRVILVVEDEPHGAVGVEEHEFNILNRAPEVELQVQGNPLPSGAYLVERQLMAVASAVDPDDEGAEPELSWSLNRPSNSDPNELVFEAEGDAIRRLVPDVPGVWEVAVEAEDAAGGTEDVSRVFEVAENTPPCIGATSPAAPGGGAYVVGADDPPKRLSVLSVEDELDPYPPRPDDPEAGEASFRWFFASPASGQKFEEIEGRDAPDFEIDPAEHAPGDVLAARVEVSDREEREIPCGEEAHTCSIGGDECIQRTTWEVEIR